jgi:acetolactate synthase I/II/III large subunit
VPIYVNGAARGALPPTHPNLFVLSPTRYDVIVEAMDGYGELVTQPQDIRPAMERARASGKPSYVNVILDPDMYSSGTMNQTMYK